MDFNFKEEQLQFGDALKRWIAKDYSFEARKKIIASEAGVSDAAWATLVELGMTALPVPQEQGGFDGSAVDMFVVMQELGRGLVAGVVLRQAQVILQRGLFQRHLVIGEIAEQPRIDLVFGELFGLLLAISLELRIEDEDAVVRIPGMSRLLEGAAALLAVAAHEVRDPCVNEWLFGAAKRVGR